MKLDEVSKILGLPGKPDGIDGSRVEEMILAGQIDEVARYCETDVLNTYRGGLVPGFWYAVVHVLQWA